MNDILLIAYYMLIICCICYRSKGMHTTELQLQQNWKKENWATCNGF